MDECVFERTGACLRVGKMGVSLSWRNGRVFKYDKWACLRVGWMAVLFERNG